MIFYGTLLYKLMSANITIHLQHTSRKSSTTSNLRIKKTCVDSKTGRLHGHGQIPKLACEPTIVDEVCPFQLNLRNQAKPCNGSTVQ